MLLIVSSLTDDSRGIIYDCNIFILLVPGYNEKGFVTFVFEGHFYSFLDFFYELSEWGRYHKTFLATSYSNFFES
jgi:hypothetical protein